MWRAQMRAWRIVSAACPLVIITGRICDDNEIRSIQSTLPTASQIVDAQ